jgi:hypothetical protein
MMWLMMAAVVAVLGMPGLLSAEGMNLQHATGGELYKCALILAKMTHTHSLIARRVDSYLGVANTIVLLCRHHASVVMRLTRRCSRRSSKRAREEDLQHDSHEWSNAMKRYIFSFLAVAAMAVLVALIAPAPGRAGAEPAPAFVTEIPQGYRDWKWISSAHEAGNLNSLGAVLGNDVAIKAFREGKLPFPDGSILAALHYRNVASDENNKVFGQVQSFVPGAPTNIQFMVKDSTKYAATGGWGFGHFQDGKPGAAAFMKSCFPCHEKTQATDLVFTRYAP